MFTGRPSFAEGSEQKWFRTLQAASSPTSSLMDSASLSRF